MSKSPAAVPDAWEDDWEDQAGVRFSRTTGSALLSS
jgi:hypothetical protein